MKPVRLLTLAVVLALLLIPFCISAPAGALTGPEVTPVEYPGNSPDTCPEGCGDYFHYRIENPTSGTYTDRYLSVTLTVHETDMGPTFDFQSNYPVTCVAVKGGDFYNLYKYTTPLKEDDGLHAPQRCGAPTETGPTYRDKYCGLSHIDFCYQIPLEVSKTAVTSFTRAYTWHIAKSADHSELTLSPGQSHDVAYEVSLDATYADSDWAVQGKITICNPAPVAATITGVSDVISGLDAGQVELQCPFSLPHTLAAGGCVECTYSASLPNASDRTNTATVTTSGKVSGGEGSAQVSFADATINQVDERASVADSLAGSLGMVCASDGLPKVFSYTRTVGPYQVCGDYTVENTASFVTNDTEATGDDSATLTIHVPCAGCTLTPGYWKTHSTYGPAAHPDDTWDLIGGPDASFYKSEQSYYQVLWTSPSGGNAYYILAHQYIAAKLNQLAGAWVPSDVATALTQATGLFETYTPGQVATMKGKAGNDLRSRLTSLAALLGAYNSGAIGPGHCSE